MKTPILCTRMGFIDHTIYVLGGILIWILFSPLLIGFAVVGTVWKLSVIIVMKIRHPDLLTTSYKDSFFALYGCDHEQQPLMSVGATFRMKGKVETGKLIERFKECFLSPEDKDRYINLYCYFTIYCGYVFKKRVSKLLVENHFIETTLPKGTEPEDYLAQWIVTDTYINKPERQPCWQVLVLRRGTEHDLEETLVSIKMHHGMADGYSLIHMIDKLTGSQSPYIVNTKREPILKTLRGLLEGTALALDVFVRVMRTPDLIEKEGNPFETKWTMSFSTLDDLQTIKDIRKKTKAKFGNIVMTAITGALKRMYIEDKNYALEDLPEQIFIESPLALSNHPSMKKGGRFCNHFTAGIYASQFKSNDHRYRLRALEQDFHDFQAHGGMKLLAWIVFGYYWLVPTWMLRQFTNYLSWLWRFCVLYSGLMGPTNKIKLANHTVENIYFLQATASAFPYVSLFIMCSSYAGKLDVTCYASKELATRKQELERLVEVHLKAELAQMRKEFCERENEIRSCVVVDMMHESFANIA